MRTKLLRFSLCLLAFSLLTLAGCAGRSADNAPLEAGATPLDVPGPTKGKSFFLINSSPAKYDSGGLSITLTAFLQSDAGMNIAESAKEADYTIDVAVQHIGRAAPRSSGVGLGDVAAPTLLGTLSGLVVGGAVGSRTGAAWGAGIGALLGVGYGVATGGGKRGAVGWQMSASVGVSPKGKAPATATLVAHAETDEADQEAATPMLETDLAQQIARSFARAR